MRNPTNWRRVLACCGLAAALPLSGCVTNPVTGESEISLMSSERERVLGRQYAAEIERTIGLVEHPATGYVKALGARLAARSPRRDVEYSFELADMPEANAFALPGGYVYVSRGLLAITNDEAELAGVIGHEIGHVAARHAAQRETRQLGVGLLSVLGAVVGGAVGGAETAKTVAQIGQVAGAGLIASYSRDQEHQADDIGQRLSAGSGFDPGGITRFLETLGRESELRLGEKRAPGFLDSHPATGDRVAATAARARSLQRAPAAPIAPDRAALLEKLRGLRVGPDPAAGVFQEHRFLHAEMGFALDFPTGWKTVNQPNVVVAIAPDERATVRLELQGPAGDPAAAARAFFTEAGVQPKSGGARRISGYPAFRAQADARSERQEIELHGVWISHPRGMFRLLGVAAAGAAARSLPFDGVAESFHALTPTERASIRERRLEVVRARAGDTLASLGSRSGNVWSLDETAIANGLSPGRRLDAGFPLKIAIERPYR